MQKKQYLIFVFITVGVLIVDQIIKFLVKTNMVIGESIPLIGSWCQLYFVENEGMAFGMSFGGSVGKLVLTLFRFVASGAIAWYLVHNIKKGIRTSFVVSLSLIFVGAVGNLIDSCFYGIIFSDSYYQVAELFPDNGGYAGLFYGRVVDMFYFPIINTVWPDWMPFFGGQPFTFFNAIFNFADAAISVGVVYLIIDQLFLLQSNSESDDKEKV